MNCPNEALESFAGTRTGHESTGASWEGLQGSTNPVRMEYTPTQLLLLISMSRTEVGSHYSFLTFLSHQLYHPGADPLLSTPASHLESSSRLLPKHAPSSRPECHHNQVNLLKNLLGSRALQVKVQNLYQARLTSRHPFLTSFQPLRTSSPGGAMLSGCWRDRAARERHSHHLLSPNTLSFPSTGLPDRLQLGDPSDLNLNSS